MRVTLLFGFFLFVNFAGFGQYDILYSNSNKPNFEKKVYVCKGDSTIAIWREESVDPATVKWYKNGKLIKTGTKEIYFTQGFYEVESVNGTVTQYPSNTFRVLETTSPNVRLIDNYFIEQQKACGTIPIFAIEIDTYHSDNIYSKVLLKNKEEVSRPSYSYGRYASFQSAGIGEYAVTVGAGACSATYEIGKIETESTTDTVRFYFNEALIEQDTLKICGKFERELSINSRNNFLPYDWYIDGKLAFKSAFKITPERSGWYHAEYATQGCLKIVKKLYISIGNNVEPLGVSYSTGGGSFRNCETKTPDRIFIILQPQNLFSAVAEQEKALLTVKDIESNTIHAQYNGSGIYYLNAPIKFNNSYEISYKFNNCETRSIISVEQREMKISVTKAFPASKNLCNNSGVRLSASSVTNGYIDTEYRSYQLTWFRNGVEFARTDNGENILITASGEYSVEAFYENCTFTSEKITVDIPTYIPTNLTVSNTFISCTENNATIKAPQAPAGFTYKWYKELKNNFGTNDSQLLANQTENTLQVSKSGEGAYYAVMTDGRCSVETETAIIKKAGVEDVKIIVRNNNVSSDESCNTSPVTLTTDTSNDIIWTGPNGFTATEKTVVAQRDGLYKLTVKDNVSGCVSTDSVIITNFKKPNVSLNVEGQICVGEPVLVKIAAERPQSNVNASRFRWDNFDNPSQSLTFTSSDTTYYSLLTYSQYKANPTLNFYAAESDGHSCLFTYNITPPAKPEAAICNPEITVTGLKPFYCVADDYAILTVNFTDKIAATKPYSVYARYQFSVGVNGEIGSQIFLGQFSGEKVSLLLDLMRPSLNYYLVFEQDGKVIYSTTQPLVYRYNLYARINVLDQNGKYITYSNTVYQCDTANLNILEWQPNRGLSNENTQWYNGGKAILGATAPRFTPTESGDYSVRSIVDGCPSESYPTTVLTGVSPLVSMVFTPSICGKNGGLIIADSNRAYLYTTYQLFRNDTLINDEFAANEYFYLQGGASYYVKGYKGSCVGASEKIVLDKATSPIIKNEIYLSNLYNETTTYAEICLPNKAKIDPNWETFFNVRKWNEYAEQNNKPELAINVSFILNGKVGEEGLPTDFLQSDASGVISKPGEYQCMLTQAGCTSVSNTVKVAVKDSIPLGLQADSPYINTNLYPFPSQNFYNDVSVQLYRNGSLDIEANQNFRYGRFRSITKTGVYSIKSKDGSCFSESNKVEIKEIPKLIVLSDTIYTCLDSVRIVSKHIVSFPTDISWTQKDGKVVSQADRTVLKSPGEYTLRSKQAGSDVEVNYVLLKAPTDYFRLSGLNHVTPNVEFCEGESISLNLGNQTQTKYKAIRSKSAFGSPHIPSFNFETNQPAADNLGLLSTVRLLSDGKLENEYQRYLYPVNDELVTIANEGNYQIEVLIDGCSYKTNTVSVKEKPFPLELSPNLPQVSICPTGGFQTLNLTPGYAYQWLRNGVDTENNSATLKTTSIGDYFALATTNGCTKVSPKIKIVEKNEAPTATISGDSIIAAGATAFLNLNYTASPPFSYQLTSGLFGVSEKMNDKIAVSPTETTIFKLVSVKNSCGEGTVNATSSATITVEPLILSNEESLTSRFNLYPVPLVNKLQLTVDLDVPQSCSFWLYNIAGNELQTKEIGKVKSYNESFDLAHLPAGTYIFKIKIGNQFYHRKVVKR
jgi:hypothetical protein